MAANAEKRYSTVRVAKMLQMAQPNLQAAIKAGRIPAPPVIPIGTVSIRLWTRAEIRAARKALKRRKRLTSD